MPDWIAPALAALTLLIVLWLALRRGDGEHTVRELRTEVQDSARATRQELAATLATFQQTLIAQQTAMSAQQGETVRTQNEQLDSFRVQLATLQQQVANSLQDATHALSRQGQATQEAQAAGLQRFGQIGKVRQSLHERRRFVRRSDFRFGALDRLLFLLPPEPNGMGRGGVREDAAEQSECHSDAQRECCRALTRLPIHIRFSF